MNVDELLYEKPTHRLVGSGNYKGIDWYILNNNGRYPLAYVQVYADSLTVPISKINELVNGGITYGYDYDGYCYWNEEDTRKYIGWDYGHFGDYCNCDGLRDFMDKKWTYNEIRKQIFDVIDLIVKSKEEWEKMGKRQKND